MSRSSRDTPPLATREPDPIAELRIAHDDGNVLMATFRNISIMVWGAQATLPLLKQFGKTVAGLYGTYTRTSNVQIILDDAPMPTPEARDAFVKLAEQAGDRLACLGVVLAGGGFWASAMRGFVTNVNWAKARPFTPRVLASVAEAAAWMAPLHAAKTSVPISPGELERVLSHLQARVPATRP